MGEIPTDSASRVETGPNAVDPQRELERLRTEAVQARARADSAAQEATQHATAVARLLQENKNLNSEMEHLRVILSQKDEVLKDLRGAPEALMTELAQLRQKHEEASAKLARIAGDSSPGVQEPLIVASGLRRPTPLFYSNRPIQVAYTLEEIADFTEEHQTKEIILAKQDIRSLSRDY